MPDTNSVKWTLSVQINGGPTLNTSGTLAPTAYERISFPLAKPTDKGTPSQQTVSLPTAMSLLAVKSDKYITGDAPLLTYQFDDSEGTALTTALILFSPTFKTLTISNGTTDDVSVEILVAHDVIVKPAADPPVKPAATPTAKPAGAK